jgi:hypothetical protein
MDEHRQMGYYLIGRMYGGPLRVMATKKGDNGEVSTFMLL